ncbi:hypothetical protein, partial [Bacillus pumilus]
EELREAFNIKIKGESIKERDIKATLDAAPTISIWERFDEFVNVNGRNNNWTKSTVAKVKVFGRHLKAFKDDVTFE